MSPWKVLLSSIEEERTTEAADFMTLGPERIHSKLWVRSRIEVSRERGSNWGSGFHKKPWVKCCGLPRLSVDVSIQTKRTRINPLTLLVGMQTSTAAMENSVEISEKTGNRTAIWPSNPTNGHTHQGNQIWRRHMHPNVHRSTVYHSQDMEAT